MAISTKEAYFQQTAGEVLELMQGKKLELDLITAASFGGTQLPPRPDQPIRFTADRSALTEIDTIARNWFIKPRMEAMSLDIYDLPLGLVGVKRGLDPDADPILLGSHFDTIDRSDMYDGVYGVVAALHFLEAIHLLRVQHTRDIMLAVFTGEESRRFKRALFGSGGMLLGLTERDHALKDTEGITLGEALGSRRLQTMQPVFGEGRLFKKPAAYLEVHVEQGKVLEQANKTLGIVTEIAAPIRHEIFVGDKSLQPDLENHPNTKYLLLTVKGVENHSGTTPMGNAHRADGLVHTAEILGNVLENQNGAASIAIGDISILGGSINKIPGIVRTALKIWGENPDEVNKLLQKVHNEADKLNQLRFLKNHPRFTYPASVDETGESEVRFFDPSEMQPRQIDAFNVIRIVEDMTKRYSSKEVVGTVGTYQTTADGRIALGLDVRGTHKLWRDLALQQIMEFSASKNSQVNFGEQLAGSCDPSKMDPKIVKSMAWLFKKFGLDPFMFMPSKAGHDAKSAIDADIPAGMIFVPSEKGIAHNIDAYTKPEHLEAGARALALIALRKAL